MYKYKYLCFLIRSVKCIVSVLLGRGKRTIRGGPRRGQ